MRNWWICLLSPLSFVGYGRGEARTAPQREERAARGEGKEINEAWKEEERVNWRNGMKATNEMEFVWFIKQMKWNWAAQWNGGKERATKQPRCAASQQLNQPFFPQQEKKGGCVGGVVWLGGHRPIKFLQFSKRIAALLLHQQMKDFQFVDWSELRREEKKWNQFHQFHSFMRMEWNGFTFLLFNQNNSRCELF